jgi:hypothetical protein
MPCCFACVFYSWVALSISDIYSRDLRIYLVASIVDYSHFSVYGCCVYPSFTGLEFRKLLMRVRDMYLVFDMSFQEVFLVTLCLIILN